MKNVFLLLSLVLLSCADPVSKVAWRANAQGTSGGLAPGGLVPVRWALAANPAPSDSAFYGLSVDTTGSVVVAGMVDTGSGFYFGSGSTVAGTASPGSPVLVKFTPSGLVSWIATNSAGLDAAFNGVGTDASNNVYAGGYVIWGSTFTFGAFSFTGAASGGADAVLVKYNAAGVVQWVQGTTASNQDNRFVAVAVDAAGNSYGSGYTRSTSSIQYGNSVTSPVCGQWSLVFVKFDTSGAAQWISTVTTGGTSFGTASATDTSGNSFLVGGVETATSFTVGTTSSGTTVTFFGTNSGNDPGDHNPNGVVVKYDSSGNPVWYATPAAGGLATLYNGAATDSSGNITVVGYLYGTGLQDFGNGKTVTSAFSGHNALLVIYDAAGTTLAVALPSSGPSDSSFTAVSSDGQGNLYAAGYITGPGTYDFGNGATTTSSITGQVPVLVKYNSSGVAQSAQTLTSGAPSSLFSGVASPSSGSIYAVGTLGSNVQTDFGNGVKATGAYAGNNALVFRAQ